jgi:hypothetical protein
MISAVQRIPKWLLSQRFEIRIYPREVIVTVFVSRDKHLKVLKGTGESIQIAAEKARPLETDLAPNWGEPWPIENDTKTRNN